MGHQDVNLPAILARVEERLRVLDLSAAAASQKAGLGTNRIRTLRRKVQGRLPPGGFNIRTPHALADALEVSPTSS